ncbi:shikimate kinase [Treponema bryantii]|uniref:Shikimate kinase n=2 Tax=Treponema bryantii TaxID=163 RepID=A0A1H9CUG4_9SPIR|nr:shikimate kinase [Treponema bryantii]SEQ04862.1 shikimate kinase [Treponema bryantii]
MNNSIVLMGCKHCGKTTQGKLLAKKLGVDFIDTDDEIGRIRGIDFRTLYKTKGVAEFTLAEEEACRSIMKEFGNSQIVVSTGGGICDNPPALQALRDCGTFVFLKLDIKHSVSRIMAKIQQTETGSFINAPAYVLNENPTSLSQIQDILMKKYRDRYQQYQAIADVVVDIKNAPIEENFRTLIDALDIK